MTVPPPLSKSVNSASVALDQPPLPSDDRSFFGQPRGLATLFFTEMWERFSYYGLRPLLVLFMVATVAQGGYGFDRSEASAIVGIYAAFVYLMSLPGGWVADRLLGLRRAIFIGAGLISAGHICIGLSGLAGAGQGKVPFFAGLILIVLGTGLLKPNISAIVGDLYPEGGARRDAGFSIFYMGINLGSFFGQLVTGYLGEQVDWHVGMGAAGVAMFIGLIVYGLRQNKTLGKIGVEPTRLADPVAQATQERTVKLATGILLGLIVVIFLLAATGVMTLNAVSVARYMTYVMVGMAVVFFAFVFTVGKLATPEKKRVLVIVILFAFAAIFWSAFEQAPTSLNLFARDFTKRLYDTSWIPGAVRLPFLALGGVALVAFVASLVAMMRGAARRVSVKMVLLLLVVGVVLLTLGALAGRPQFEVPATWFQSVNPLVVILFAPATAALWVTLAKRRGDLSSPAKFALGLLLAGVGFAIMIYAANAVVSSGGATLVSPWWLVASYFFQSIGELCLSPVGLSSMTKLSPRKYVGQMMGIWFLASALGNLIGGRVGGHVDPNKLEQMPRLFTTTTISLFAAAVILAILIIPIRRMMSGTPDVTGHSVA